MTCTQVRASHFQYTWNNKTHTHTTRIHLAVLDKIFETGNLLTDYSQSAKDTIDRLIPSTRALFCLLSSSYRSCVYFVLLLCCVLCCRNKRVPDLADLLRQVELDEIAAEATQSYKSPEAEAEVEEAEAEGGEREEDNDSGLDDLLAELREEQEEEVD
jgi:hypothetical protein